MLAEPLRVCLVDPDMLSRASVVRALLRESVEVSFDESERSAATIRRNSKGWSLAWNQGTTSTEIYVSVSALVRMICDRLTR